MMVFKKDNLMGDITGPISKSTPYRYFSEMQNISVYASIIEQIIRNAKPEWTERLYAYSKYINNELSKAPAR